MAESPRGVNVSLFRGRLVYLAAIDVDKDAPVESRWSRDVNFLHLYTVDQSRPMAVYQIKKAYKDDQKWEGVRKFTFGVHAVADDRLVGKVRVFYVDWAHGNAWFDMGIGLPEDRGHGYGKEMMALLTRFIFEELNLVHLIVRIAEYNQVAAAFLEKSGFEAQVRLRQSIHRGGQTWDVLYYALDADTWDRLNPAEGGEA